MCMRSSAAMPLRVTGVSCLLRGVRSAHRVVDAAHVLHEVKEQMFCRTIGPVLSSTGSSAGRRDPGGRRTGVDDADETVQTLVRMCIPKSLVTRSMVQRFKFWKRFLGDEQLVKSKLGREYLMLSDRTRQVQDDVRHLRLLRRCCRTTDVLLLEQLQQRLSAGLDDVRQAFAKARNDSDYEESLLTQLRQSQRQTESASRPPPGCLISFLSQQLTVTRFDVRTQLAQHPFSGHKSVSPLAARHMLTLLVAQEHALPHQIRTALYAVLYDPNLVAHFFGSLTSADKAHPRALDLAIYNLERRFGHLSHRHLFGAAVFIDADHLIAPVCLPAPSHVTPQST